MISAHTWVVTEISVGSTFAQVGDELTFYDNRLYFKNSNGIETDGRWNFSGDSRGPFISSSVDGVSVVSGFGSYDFSIINLTNTELELNDSFINVRLKPAE